jgi:IS605 OrfB family transposase
MLVLVSVVKVVRTIQLKVTGSTKIDTLMAAWLESVNWLSEIVFETEEINSNRLCRSHYANLRQKGLQAQLACSACKWVCATYKTAKAMDCWKLSTFKVPTLPIVWNRDFSFTRRGLRLWGEPLVIHNPQPIPPPSTWCDSKLKRKGKTWYLLLSYEVEVPELKSIGCLVGVDSGIKRMLTATNSANSNSFFFHGGVLNHRRSCIRRTRATVQAVGTRSSRRLLQRLSGNEAAVTGHLLHVASKALVRWSVEQGAERIVMEDLSNVRDASLSKGKDLRSKVHRWPYGQAQQYIAYKAQAEGIDFELVSPRNTSRGCAECGYVSASNRIGLHFHCGRCGHQEDADRHASRNIRCRSVSIAHNAAETGSHKPPQSSEPFEIDSGAIALCDASVSV